MLISNLRPWLCGMLAFAILSLYAPGGMMPQPRRGEAATLTEMIANPAAKDCSKMHEKGDTSAPKCMQITCFSPGVLAADNGTEPAEILIKVTMQTVTLSEWHIRPPIPSA